MYDSRVETGDRLYYFTAPPALRSLNAHCTTVGSSTTPSGAAYPSHPLAHPHAYRSMVERGRVLDEWQFVFVSRGSGSVVTADGTSATVRSNDLIVVRPGVRHQYRPDESTGWTEYWVGFAGEVFDASLRAVGLAERPALVACADVPAMLAAFDELLRLAPANHTAGRLAMIGVVMQMVGLIASWAGPHYLAGHSLEVREAIRGMSEHPVRVLSVAALAARVGLSESALRRRFVRETGMSPYHYYNTIRVDRIKMRLAHSTSTLGTIAEELGFTDGFHLSRVFKQYTGLAPSEWRVRGG